MQACWLTCAHYIVTKSVTIDIRRSPIMQARWLTCAHYIIDHWEGQPQRYIKNYTF